jgi:hypothetical protein
MASTKLANCMWCETPVRADVKLCPECGLESPVLKAETVMAAASPKRRIGSRGIALAVAAVPLMLSAAYAAGLKTVVVGAAPAAVTVSTAAPAALTDPLQRAVWTDGVKSVQTALNDPHYNQFSDRFVSVSDGRIVSFCGSMPNSDMGQQRFISIFGQRYSTVLEGSDGSFDVLWNRVCANPVKSA